jgi:single-stranded-DNA-specific exonuclease
MKLETRDIPPRATWALEQAGVHPLLARLLAARGVTDPQELDDSLALLLPPTQLKGAQEAAQLLADAIAADEAICFVADYDCDGATACAVGIRGLRLLGARRLDYLVPDRVVDGYGLTPPIAERVIARGAQVLITVDNGIASLEGVATARAAGIKVLVTDHHLPASTLPAANVIVNPNQPGCPFASKALAGVGVMFYVLLALRAQLRARGAFGNGNTGDAQTPAQPRLDNLLPLVALGTVADVVRLDANNRRLVAQGLRRIRAGHMPAGMAALFAVAARAPARASSDDFGMAIGPRINAAGRLSDMTLGIELLLTDEAARAADLARTLDALNRQRRELEGDMRDQAMLMAEDLFAAQQTPPPALAVFDAHFHEGVVGIVAARLKDRLHRPSFVFAVSGAQGREQELKGSGRSIAGFHLRDALDFIAKQHPGILLKFGGHAMAAGCTIARARFGQFEQAFQQVASQWLDEATLTQRLETDGPLPAQYRRIDVADMLDQCVWGQGFGAPVFSEELDVLSQRLVGERHLALKLRHQGQVVDGIWFGRTDPLPARAQLAFRFKINEWNGQRQIQFMIEGCAD